MFATSDRSSDSPARRRAARDPVHRTPASAALSLARGRRFVRRHPLQASSTSSEQVGQRALEELEGLSATDVVAGGVFIGAVHERELGRDQPVGAEGAVAAAAFDERMQRATIASWVRCTAPVVKVLGRV
jgi:hypothetical protein